MIIVIEGVDKSGKSTLASEVAKAFPGIMIKITDKPKNGEPEEREKIKNHYMRIKSFIGQNPNVDFIIDRFFPSEICYSVKRGYEAKEDFKFFKELENWFVEKKEHLFLYCNPGINSLIKRMKDTPDEYVTLKENLDILKRYEDFFDHTKLNYIKVDTNRPVNELVEQIKKHVYEYQGHREHGEQLTLL